MSAVSNAGPKQPSCVLNIMGSTQGSFRSEPRRGSVGKVRGHLACESGSNPFSLRGLLTTLMVGTALANKPTQATPMNERSCKEATGETVVIHTGDTTEISTVLSAAKKSPKQITQEVQDAFKKNRLALLNQSGIYQSGVMVKPIKVPVKCSDPRAISPSVQCVKVSSFKDAEGWTESVARCGDIETHKTVGYTKRVYKQKEIHFSVRSEENLSRQLYNQYCDANGLNAERIPHWSGNALKREDFFNYVNHEIEGHITNVYQKETCVRSTNRMRAMEELCLKSPEASKICATRNSSIPKFLTQQEWDDKLPQIRAIHEGVNTNIKYKKHGNGELTLPPPGKADGECTAYALRKYADLSSEIPVQLIYLTTKAGSIYQFHMVTGVPVLMDGAKKHTYMVLCSFMKEILPFDVYLAHADEPYILSAVQSFEDPRIFKSAKCHTPKGTVDVSAAVWQ